MVFLREAEGLLRKVQGLLGVRGLQHGDLSSNGIVPGVLLVLGGEHPRVVGHTDYQPGLHPLIGDGKQGVCGHIEAHMLHAAGGPLTTHRGSMGHFQRHLLVGGPLAVDLRILGSFLGDLRTGGAGIAGDHTAPGLV